MSILNVFSIAGSALNAQSQRLNVVASNLANADSTTSSTGQPYRARQVVFQAIPMGGNQVKFGAGVKVSQIIEDPSPMKKVFDPKHPAAAADGYVSYPNVNPVEEMVNMISASRAYQNSVDVMSTSKAMLQKLLALGQ